MFQVNDCVKYLINTESLTYCPLYVCNSAGRVSLSVGLTMAPQRFSSIIGNKHKLYLKNNMKLKDLQELINNHKWEDTEQERDKYSFNTNILLIKK